MAEQFAFLKAYTISKYFKQGFETTTVLDNVSYTFEQGRSYAITGVSGTGKSTFLYILAALERPQSGTIFFNSADIYQLERRERSFFLQKNIGFIFQNPLLLEDLSVSENVMIKGFLASQNYASAYERALSLLENVGLKAKAQNSCRTLSGGEQQRVAIARALFTVPAFLLADEPTAHVDQRGKQSIIDLMLSCVQRYNTGLIIATHDEDVAGQMDVVLKLHEGKLLPVSY